MAKMTKKDALNIAIANLTDEHDEARAILMKMAEQLSKSRTMSDEAKSALNAKRKAATATARAALIETVAPVLRKYLTQPMTAKELFAAAQAELPADFTAPKVQNILIREMAPELVKVEAKGKANTYELIKA